MQDLFHDDVLRSGFGFLILFMVTHQTNDQPPNWLNGFPQ